MCEGIGWIVDIEVKERVVSGIGIFKIDYNKKDGYYFYVINFNLLLVLEYFFCKVMLKNFECYGIVELVKIEGEVFEVCE